MKKLIARFKKFIRTSVTIFASREFAFVYCIVGTLAQLAHTYFLTASISSFDGNIKIIQAIIVSFFISSSLLYFTAIADNEQTKESKRIRTIVNLFMFVEILINIYYYSRHLILDVKDIQIFDFIFGVLVSCLIPITIKFYATSIRAKEWMQEMETSTENKIFSENNKITEYIDNEIIKFKDEWNKSPLDIESINSYINDAGEKMKQEILNSLDKEISIIFEKNQTLFLNQFENKCKLIIGNQLNKTN